MKVEETPSHAWLGIVAVMIIALFAVLSCKPPKDKAPVAPVVTATLSTGTQSGLWDTIPAACKVQGAPLAIECLEGTPGGLAALSQLACPDQGGIGPCLWVDPVTFDWWYVPPGVSAVPRS